MVDQVLLIRVYDKPKTEEACDSTENGDFNILIPIDEEVKLLCESILMPKEVEPKGYKDEKKKDDKILLLLVGKKFIGVSYLTVLNPKIPKATSQDR